MATSPWLQTLGALPAPCPRGGLAPFTFQSPVHFFLFHVSLMEDARLTQSPPFLCAPGQLRLDF